MSHKLGVISYFLISPSFRLITIFKFCFAGQNFGMEEFIKRVSQKEGVDPTAAVMYVRSVFAVLQEAVSPGEFADLQVNLSDDYAELFATLKPKEVSTQ